MGLGSLLVSGLVLAVAVLGGVAGGSTSADVMESLAKRIKTLEKELKRTRSELETTQSELETMRSGLAELRGPTLKQVLSKYPRVGSTHVTATEGSSASSSTKPTERWLAVDPGNVRKWSDGEFERFLEGASRIAYNRKRPLQAFLSAHVPPSNQASFLGMEPRVEIEERQLIQDFIAGLGAGFEFLSRTDEFVSRELRAVLHGSGPCDSLVRVGKHYAQLYKPDLVLESWIGQDQRPIPGLLVKEKKKFRKIVRELRLKRDRPELDDDAYLAWYASDCSSRIVVEAKLDEKLPKNLHDYYASPVFDRNINPLAQVVTYALLQRSRLACIWTQQRVVYVKVDVKSDGELDVLVSRDFDWAQPSSALGRWSHLETLFRFLVAGYTGEAYINAFPGKFKEDFKRRADGGGGDGGDGRGAHRGSHGGSGGGSAGGSGSRGGGGGAGGSGSRGGGGAGGSGSRSGGSGSRGGGGGAGGSGSRSANAGRGGGGTFRSPSSTTRSAAAHFRSRGLCYADLWASDRFANPPTVSLAREMTWRELDGDAEWLRWDSTGAVGLKTIDGFPIVVKYFAYGGSPAFKSMSSQDIERRLERLRRERDTYDRLTSLQGDTVPAMVWSGDLLEGMVWAVATEYSGQPLDKLAEAGSLAPHTANSARRALRRLHESGVLHGDVRLAQFVVDEHGRVRVLDFELARWREEEQDLSDEAWNELCAEENEALAKLLGSVGEVAAFSDSMRWAAASARAAGVDR